MSCLVYKAINNVQAALSVDGIGKNRTNTQGATYKFRGIDDVLNALAPLLAKHQLCILPRVISRECTERLSKSGGNLFYVTVEAEFDFVSTEDGSKHTVKTYGEAMDSSDKATNKAMSAAYKYAALQAFAIPTEGDNDADSSTHESSSPIKKFTPKVASTFSPTQSGYSHSEVSAEDLETLFSELKISAHEGGNVAFMKLWKTTNPVITKILKADTARMNIIKVECDGYEARNEQAKSNA